MPHTKDGMEVVQGNTYNLPVRVTSVQSAPEYCNCNIETVEPMFPTNQPTLIVVNTKQLLAIQVTHQPPPGVADPMSQPIDDLGRPKAQLQAQVVGLGIPDVVDFARHAVNVLKKAGDAAIEVIQAGFKMYSAFTDRDLGKILSAFNEAQDRVQSVINAIREEFQLHEDEEHGPAE